MPDIELNFSRAEYAERLAKVQTAMAVAGIDCLLVTDPSGQGAGQGTGQGADKGAGQGGQHRAARRRAVNGAEKATLKNRALRQIVF